MPPLSCCPKVIISSCPRGMQWWWTDQRQQGGSDTSVTAAALQKLELTFSCYENAIHTCGGAACAKDTNSSSQAAAAASAAELLLSGTGWGSQVPPPAEALHLSIQSCMVFITITCLSANCKALGDSENKATHTHRGSKILQLQCYYQSICPYCT